jgi:uncharacterized protein (DUF983 family)
MAVPPTKTQTLPEDEKKKVYDALAIPKRNLTILLAWLLVAFMLIILYVAIMVNAVAYGMLALLPLIAFLRPEAVPQKKNNMAAMLQKAKTILFWGGLSAVIYGIQMGLFFLITQEFFTVEDYSWIDGNILLYFIFPLTTLCFDVIIFNLMAFFHQNEQGKQYKGWKKEGYSRHDAEHMVNVKFGKVLKIAVAITILLFVYSLFVIIILNVTDIIPTPSTTQFTLIVASIVIVVAIVSVRRIKKKMIANQLRQLNQPAPN